MTTFDLYSNYNLTKDEIRELSTIDCNNINNNDKLKSILDHILLKKKLFFEELENLETNIKDQIYNLGLLEHLIYKINSYINNN